MINVALVLGIGLSVTQGGEGQFYTHSLTKPASVQVVKIPLRYLEGEYTTGNGIVRIGQNLSKYKPLTWELETIDAATNERSRQEISGLMRVRNIGVSPLLLEIKTADSTFGKSHFKLYAIQLHDQGFFVDPIRFDYTDLKDSSLSFSRPVISVQDRKLFRTEIRNGQGDLNEMLNLAIPDQSAAMDLRWDNFEIEGRLKQLARLEALEMLPCDQNLSSVATIEGLAVPAQVQPPPSTEVDLIELEKSLWGPLRQAVKKPTVEKAARVEPPPLTISLPKAP